MVPKVLEAVEQHGEVDAEVIDLRWLDRASIDWDTIEASITKTSKVLIAEQGAIGTSYGGWLADEIHRRFVYLLDAPVHRVTGGEASPSISKVLERAAIAETAEVVAGLQSSTGSDTPPPLREENRVDMTRRRVLTGAAAGVGAAATPATAEAAGGRHRHHREYVVTGAYVLTMDPALGDLPAATSTSGTADRRRRAGPATRAQRIDGRGMVVMPGLVDTHWHLWTTLLPVDGELVAGTATSRSTWPTGCAAGRTTSTRGSGSPWPTR